MRHIVFMEGDHKVSCIALCLHAMLKMRWWQMHIRCCQLNVAENDMRWNEKLAVIVLWWRVWTSLITFSALSREWVTVSGQQFRGRKGFEPVYKSFLCLSAAAVPGFNNFSSLFTYKAVWFLEGLQLISQWWALTSWQPDEWYWHGLHLSR